MADGVEQDADSWGGSHGAVSWRAVLSEKIHLDCSEATSTTLVKKDSFCRSSSGDGCLPSGQRSSCRLSEAARCPRWATFVLNQRPPCCCYSPSQMNSQLCPDILWVPLLGLLLLCIPAAHAAKCPQQCVCDQIQLAVTCVNKNLTGVPPTVDEITVKLDLRGNDIWELPTGAFKHTPYLIHLSLQRCNIRRVKKGAFRGLGRLVFLNLANNNIEILYQESFDGLSSLKQLMIDHNQVEEIQPGAFSQLGFLNLLSLTHNQLVYIPNLAFQGLQNIKLLRLSHNSLNYLDTEAFAGLFTLIRLRLDHNELRLFPTETMTRLPEVTRLDLSYNPMIFLGEEAVSMAKLTHLFLDHMFLQELVNTAVSKCPSLTHLDVSHNELRVIQPFSEGPPKLARLNLAGNPIYCNSYLRPLREWAIQRKVKLLGTCRGPAHLSGKNLDAVYPPELRCQSQIQTSGEPKQKPGSSKEKSHQEP